MKRWSIATAQNLPLALPCSQHSGSAFTVLPQSHRICPGISLWMSKMFIQKDKARHSPLRPLTTPAAAFYKELKQKEEKHIS